MNQEFITDIESLRNAQTELAKLAELAKPWKDYSDKLVEYIVAKYFREYPYGKHPVALPSGALVEYEKSENVAVKEELLEVVFNQITDARKALDANEVQLTPSELAAVNGLHKLVVWKPGLSRRDYDKLPKFAQDIFEQALQRTLAKPKITIKEQK